MIENKQNEVLMDGVTAQKAFFLFVFFLSPQQSMVQLSITWFLIPNKWLMLSLYMLYIIIIIFFKSKIFNV